MKWYLKQLLPLAYWTRYRDGADRQHFCIWKMWLGRCYSVTDVIIGGT